MLKQTVTIKGASAEDIYDVLMDSDKHSDLISDTAEVGPEVGDKFVTFGSYADGENLELVPGKLIRQTWRASDWPEGHYSEITFELADKDEDCEITFTQDNLPEGTQEEFESGWEDFYWQPLKDYFDN